MQDTVINVRARTVVVVIALVLGAALLVGLVRDAWQVFVWFFIAAFLATALNRAVELLLRLGVRSRGVAVGITFLLTVVFVALLLGLLIPPAVKEVNGLIQAIPGYVDDLSRGEGFLGRLDREYDVVARVKKALEGVKVGSVLNVSGTALSVAGSIVNGVFAVVTITFLTLFMLLEGPRWVRAFYGLLPPSARPRWEKVGDDVNRTIGGYIAGNLAISLIAGTASAIVLLTLGVPYAVALSIVVGLLDLIPLVGATIAAVLVCAIGFAANGVTALIVLAVFFFLYQILENNVIQPVVYGNTVRLSPLAVLVAVLIGSQLMGVVGALFAIPVAGALQVFLQDVLSHRYEQPAPAPAVAGPTGPDSS